MPTGLWTRVLSCDGLEFRVEASGARVLISVQGCPNGLYSGLAAFVGREDISNPRFRIGGLSLVEGLVRLAVFGVLFRGSRKCSNVGRRPPLKMGSRRYVASEGHPFEQVIMERESPEVGSCCCLGGGVGG